MTDFLNYRIDGYIAAGDDQSVATLQQVASLKLPPHIDLRPMCSPIENQGGVGSCTANAVVGALEYHQIRHGQKLTNLSRLFVYYNARRLSDREQVDTGTSMPHVMASVLAFGACPEQLWPYDEARWSQRPSEECYHKAITLPGLHYAQISPGEECKSVLAAGLPVVFAMRVPTQALMVVAAESGHVPAPQGGQWEQPDGAHAMLIVGYDDGKNAFLVRNSWGPTYAEGGHVWIDYAVMDHYCLRDGFWTVGDLDRNKFFKLSGPSPQVVQEQTMAKAPPSVAEEVSRFRRGLRQQLETHLDETKTSLRDRLRGPGAGGGYDKGPGAGGGYDKGPGVGGGYDKGPGAGGGYDD